MAFSDMFLIAQGKQSVIHDLDPRTKLCFLGTVIILSVAFSGPYFLIGIFLGLILLVVGSHLFLEWLKMLKGIFYFVIFIFLGNTFIYGYVESPKPLNLLDLQNWVRIASLGVDYGFIFAMRLLIFSGLMILFVLTTDLEDLGVALRKLGFPYDLVFGVVASARFIPVLINDTETIMKARMVKGVEFQHGSFFTKIRRYASLLVPLVIVAVRRSYRLAEAMDSRGFGAEKKRTYYSDVNMRILDWILSSFFLVLLVLGIFYRFSIFPQLL